MFVFQQKDLPKEPVFPADLEKLGYFINDQDQIRKIADPAEEFQFKINKNPRWNELQREAMNACIRNIVSVRLRNLGLVTLRLPLTSKSTEPYVPILVSKNLSTASRVIVVFGEPIQDLGIWAYRTVGTESIDAGSAIAFTRAVLSKNDKASSSEKTALVLANTGQLTWHCGTRQPMTLTSWMNMPRKSAVDPALVMTRRNNIPGNEYWQNHVDYVFEKILAARGRLVKKDAKIGVIGLADGGLGAIRYLAGHWESWRPYISAICLGNPLQLTSVDLGDNRDDPSSFASFVSSRCRSYVLSEAPMGMPVTSPLDHGCNCYSAGEALNLECIMPRARAHMLHWLEETFANPELFEAKLEITEVNSDSVAEDSVARAAEGADRVFQVDEEGTTELDSDRVVEVEAGRMTELSSDKVEEVDEERIQEVDSDKVEEGNAGNTTEVHDEESEN
ncbi:hypothetical protein BO70DRAFT_307468 [Aspergillus heteromorphus CBS 117.55]|uniref:Arb2 domain-containing protein n=1 Tax=Aspergillus heteromorphus CBS 117.55 TaxID=1448321 RepID=A0A317X1Z5_9EURO|nr:uncharacterized protein BO70DRAFT_307468 [Aspergillus heteromorphus CBS 117.55]PWY91008.1 hypothetical protein BO70DRAFT_307468 [Aspergillus heteromorphus CBS 117.55]